MFDKRIICKECTRKGKPSCNYCKVKGFITCNFKHNTSQKGARLA